MAGGYGLRTMPTGALCSGACCRRHEKLRQSHDERRHAGTSTTSVTWHNLKSPDLDWSRRLLCRNDCLSERIRIKVCGVRWPSQLRSRLACTCFSGGRFSGLIQILDGKAVRNDDLLFMELGLLPIQFPKGQRTRIWIVPAMGGPATPIRDDGLVGAISSDGTRTAFLSGR